VDHPKESYIEVLRREIAEWEELRKTAERNAQEANARLNILIKRIATNQEVIRQLEEGPQPQVPPGEYARLELSEAIFYCLERFGREVAVKDELVPALVAGGALKDTSEQHRWRIVLMTITKNPDRVRLDRDKDTAELIARK
jgi:hypothetical protein